MTLFFYILQIHTNTNYCSPTYMYYCVLYTNYILYYNILHNQKCILPPLHADLCGRHRQWRGVSGVEDAPGTVCQTLSCSKRQCGFRVWVSTLPLLDKCQNVSANINDWPSQSLWLSWPASGAETASPMEKTVRINDWPSQSLWLSWPASGAETASPREKTVRMQTTSEVELPPLKWIYIVSV